MKKGRILSPLARTCMVSLAWLPLAGQADEIAFEDQRGKAITLAQPAQRVVVFPKPIAPMFIAVDGGTQHLVGLHPTAQSVIMGSILGAIFPEIAKLNTNIVREGFVPNVEEVLKAGPDVVVQWALKTEDYIEPMERVGLTVVGLGYGTNEIERERIAILGKILDQDERAKAFLSWQDEVRGFINATLSNIPTQSRARIVFFDRFRSDGMAVFGRDEFFFQAAGLRNAAFEAGLGQPTVTVEAEQLLEWDPDVIFLNYYDESAKPEDLYSHPVLAGLKAVQARRVYKTPRLDPASHEAPLVWMWMAMLAYPEHFDWDLRQHIRDRYDAVYDRALAGDEVDHLIQMPANANGKHYQTKF